MHAIRKTLRPHVALRRGLAPILVAAAAAACGETTGTTDPEPETPPRILLLGDDRSEAHITEILTEAGMDVVDGGLFHDFTGDDLDDADAVFLISGYDYSNDMEDTGEAALMGYVMQGGGLVTTEWLTYSVVQQSYHQTIQTVLPSRYGGGYSSGSEGYLVVSAGHPVTEGLPSSFTIPAANEYSFLEPKSGAETLVFGNKSGAAVITWDAPGPVVSWNGTAEYDGTGSDVWNDDLDALLVNAARYAADNTRDDGPVELQHVHFVQRYLTVLQDGDSGDNPGDFYVTARITNETNGEESELAGYYDRLQSANEGVQALNDTVSVWLPKVDGLEFTARLSYNEYDGGDARLSTGNTFSYAYDADQDCWARTFGSDVCVDASTTDDGDLALQGVNGAPVDVELTWRVRVE